MAVFTPVSYTHLDVYKRQGEQFSLIPKAAFEIRAVEPFRAKSASGGSYMRPSEDGTRPGVFYVNTYDPVSYTHLDVYKRQAGTLLWPMVFILTDVINEFFGKRGVKFISWLAVALIVYCLLYTSRCV